MSRLIRWLVAGAVLVLVLPNVPAPLIAVLVGGTATLTLLGITCAGGPARRAARRRQRPLRRVR